jgi:hypothetical protein
MKTRDPEDRPEPEADAEVLYPVELTGAEIALLLSALDSHEYWQLSDSQDRNNGASTVEDGEDEEIDDCRALTEKLAQVRQPCGRTAG